MGPVAGGLLSGDGCAAPGDLGAAGRVVRWRRGQLRVCTGSARGCWLAHAGSLLGSWQELDCQCDVESDRLNAGLVERARTGHLLPVSLEGKRHGIAGSTVAGSFRCCPPNRPCQAVEALWMTFPAACGVSAVDEQHHPPESQRHGPALPLTAECV